jgi:hypothetical protein
MNIGEHAGQPTSALTTTDDWLHIFFSQRKVGFSLERSSARDTFFK